MQTVCIWKNREALRKAAVRVEKDAKKSERRFRICKVLQYILAGCALFCSGVLAVGGFLAVGEQPAGILITLFFCSACLAVCGIYLMVQKQREPCRLPAWYVRYRLDEKVFEYVQAGKPITFGRDSLSEIAGKSEREADYALIDFDQRQVFAMAEAENGEIYFGTADLEDLHFSWQSDDEI